ncbi:hypothetical protein [Paraburkholderia sp. J41]|uniref:hypothetical protein n=1 Tax=Paraburkholderia sp. J41 TaxID=2805433 RepID=UPI002AC31FA7|nr:hypothetical protein [Paraburkholderia sp. J41]
MRKGGHGVWFNSVLHFVVRFVVRSAVRIAFHFAFYFTLYVALRIVALHIELRIALHIELHATLRSTLHVTLHVVPSFALHAIPIVFHGIFLALCGQPIPGASPMPASRKLPFTAIQSGHSHARAPATCVRRRTDRQDARHHTSHGDAACACPHSRPRMDPSIARYLS